MLILQLMANRMKDNYLSYMIWGSFKTKRNLDEISKMQEMLK